LDRGCRPSRHINPADGLQQPAWKVAALAGDVEPQGRIGVFRIEHACLVEIGKRLGQGAAVEICMSTTEIRGHGFWIEPDRFAGVRDGAVVAALAHIDPGPVGVGNGVSGIEPDRFASVRDGAVVVALAHIVPGPVGVGGEVSRIEPDCFTVVCDGAVVVALVQISPGPVGVGGEVPRIEPDCFTGVRDGAVVVALAHIGPGPVGVGDSVSGIEPDRFAGVRDAAVVVALAHIDPGPVGVGDGAVTFGFSAALDNAPAGRNAAVRIAQCCLAIIPVALTCSEKRTRDHKPWPRPPAAPKSAYLPPLHANREGR
jgi:hypothetical protein